VGASDGTTCNDGNACTQTDTCQGGICTGGNPIVCPTPAACHMAGTCNTTTGVCSNPTAPDNTACNANLGSCQSGSCNTPRFTRYGPDFSPRGISADGSIVAGSATNVQTARWTRATGVQAIEWPLGGNGCTLNGISADGQYEVGNCAFANSDPVRWMGLSGGIDLGLPGQAAHGEAKATSSNGSVTCGNLGTAAGAAAIGFWRSGSSPTILTNATNVTNAYCAAVNGDGTVLVGAAQADLGGGNLQFRSMRWTQAAGMALIPLPPGAGATGSTGAVGVSTDGTKVVGSFNASLTQTAYVYNATTGTITPVTFAGDNSSSGDAISDDGTTVAGHGPSGVWLAVNGAAPVLLGTTLAGLGVDITGFSLTAVVDMSADGKVIVGYGSSAAGMEGWIAVLK
jgi:hypothetical protein